MEAIADIIPRSYPRYSANFPLSFSLIDKITRKVICTYKGIARDISISGIKFEAEKMPALLWHKIERKEVYLRLVLSPFGGYGTRQEDALPMWFQHHTSLLRKRGTTVGAFFLDYARTQQRQEVIDHISFWQKARKAFSAIAIITAISASLYWGISVRQGVVHQQRVNQYYIFHQDGIARESFMKELRFLEGELREKISQTVPQISQIQEYLQNAKNAYQSALDELVKIPSAEDLDQQAHLSENLQRIQEQIGAYQNRAYLKQREKMLLEERLVSVQGQLRAQETQYAQSLSRKGSLQEYFYAYALRAIRAGQDRRTGLVGYGLLASDAGTKEQALLAMAFCAASHYRNADRILGFYKSVFDKKLLKSLYGIHTGAAGTRAILSVEDTLWVGIAALHYAKRTQHDTYLRFAQEIADLFLYGHKRSSWSEHVLSYLFFTLLYQATHDVQYQAVRQEEMQWIAPRFYFEEKQRGVSYEEYVWLLLSLGREEALRYGFDAEETLNLLALASRTTSLVSPKRNDVSSVRGFGALADKESENVSVALTSSMALLFKKKSEESRARKEGVNEYQMLADRYIDQVVFLLLTDPHVNRALSSRAGSGSDTFSLSDTAFILMAYKGYNPFSMLSPAEMKAENLTAVNKSLDPQKNSPEQEDSLSVRSE